MRKRLNAAHAALGQRRRLRSQPKPSTLKPIRPSIPGSGTAVAPLVVPDCPPLLVVLVAPPDVVVEVPPDVVVVPAEGEPQSLLPWE